MRLFVRLIFIMFLSLIVACNNTTNSDSRRKNSKELIIKTKKLWNRLKEFDNDSDLNKSPMRFYAKSHYDLTNKIIRGLTKSEIDSEQVFNNITLLKYRSKTHSINDSITKAIDKILSFKSGNNYKVKNIKNRLLRANYLYMNEMFVALMRIKKRKESLPYMISGGKKIIKNRDMNAVVVIPDKNSIKSIVFISPMEPMKVDYHRNHFIYIHAKPRSKQDSISVKITLKDTTKNNMSREVILTKYYEVI